MSVHAVAAALDHPVGDPSRKLILIGMANHAHKDGTCAFAAVDTLASYAGCSVRTVQRHLAVLLADGFIREGDQTLIDPNIPATRRPILYDVALTAADVERWKTEYADGGRRAAAVRNGAIRRTSPQVRRGDNLASHRQSAEAQVRRGDNLAPHQLSVRGDTESPFEVTDPALRGDTVVSPKPSTEPTTEPTTTASAALRDGDAAASDEGQQVHPVATPPSAQVGPTPADDSGAQGPDGGQQVPPADALIPEPQSKPKRGKARTPMTEDAQPDDRARADALAIMEQRGAVGRVNAAQEWEQFRDHHVGHGTTMADWNAAWRTWMRNACSWGRSGGRGGGGRQAYQAPKAQNSADDVGAQVFALTGRGERGE